MRYLFALLFPIIAFTACKDRVICPAFQSAYILDDSVRMIYYSYLWKLDEAERTKYLSQRANGNAATPTTANIASVQLDSSGIAVLDSTGVLTASIADSPTPGKKDYWAYTAEYKVPEREVRKTKYGIVKYEPYWLKNYNMRTAPMENVLAPNDKKLPPGLEEDTASVDQGEFYASDFGDSLAMDSTAVIADVQDSTEEEFVLPTLARAPPPEPEPEPEYLYRYDPKDKMLNMEQDYYNKYFGEYLIKQPKKKKEADLPKTGAADSTSMDTGQSNDFAPSDGASDSFTDGEEEGLSKKELKQKRKAEKEAQKAAEAASYEEESPAAEEPEDSPEPQEAEPQEQEGGDMGF